MMAGAFACGIGLMCVVPLCARWVREIFRFPNR